MGEKNDHDILIEIHTVMNAMLTNCAAHNKQIGEHEKRIQKMEDTGATYWKLATAILAIINVALVIVGLWYKV
jgi:hypothetical protein